LEIGPGLGALTEHFVSSGYKITVMEKDRGLAAYLREQYSGRVGFTLLEGDALELIPRQKENFTLVAGNLPYNISTPLLMALLELPQPPPRLFFTVQVEMAKRVAALPGNRDYGAVSVLVQSEYDVEIIRKIPATVFYPQPEVESAALSLTRKSQPLITPQDRVAFREFVKKGFSQRRKKLSNLLPVQDSRRAEQLAVSDWLALYQAVS
jgi:16S rRNA (adenine1518-N6/adenine1519-N6)-dimethyltransferase